MLVFIMLNIYLLNLVFVKGVIFLFFLFFIVFLVNIGIYVLRLILFFFICIFVFLKNWLGLFFLEVDGSEYFF